MKAQNIQQTIDRFEQSLKEYRKEIEKNPSSFFYKGLIKETEEYIEELQEELKKKLNSINIGKAPKGNIKKVNEATSTDYPILKRLENEYGWKIGDTLLYQQIYELPENLKKEYPNFKNIRPDIVLQDLNGEVFAVIENNLNKENKDLLKLRTVITHLLKPRFLYACSPERILFYDNTWKGLDAGEFKQVTSFQYSGQIKKKVGSQRG
jgi:hypothetical protein